MIKDFENYTKVQAVGGNCTQWQKQYKDGQIARCVVDNTGVTRELVRKAFQVQEAGIKIECFSRKVLDMNLA